MPNSDFANFVASQQIPQQPGFDWTKERDEFITRVAGLYENVNDFLVEYLADGSVQISHDEIEVDEETYGSYKIARLLIQIGQQKFFLEPVATMLIGSKGRVDLVGPIKRVPILLIRESARNASDLIHVSVGINGQPPPPPPEPQEEPWIWKVRSQQNPYAFDPLDKERFLAAVLEAGRR